MENLQQAAGQGNKFEIEEVPVSSEGMNVQESFLQPSWEFFPRTIWAVW